MIKISDWTWKCNIELNETKSVLVNYTNNKVGEKLVRISYKKCSGWLEETLIHATIVETKT